MYTTTTPVDAYRGAGRPEATFLIERLVDIFAREIGMDPVEVRRKNFIPADKFPYTTATGLTYDSGNYEAALDKALEHARLPGLPAGAGRGAEAGPLSGHRRRSRYIEICGLGPSQVAGAVGFGGGLYDSADRAGVSHRRGPGLHRRQAARPGRGDDLRPDRGRGVRLSRSRTSRSSRGDTETTPQGWGTYGSRTTAVCGSAVKVAAQRVKEKAKKIAAHLLEANEQDIEWKDGKFAVRGSPDQAKTFAEVALMANLGWNMPAGRGAGPRGHRVLRSHQLRLSRSAPTSAPSRSTPRPAR